MTVELRAPALDDVEALTDLINRDIRELYGEEDETPESIKLWLTTPGMDPVEDMRIAFVDGAILGYVDIYADPEPTYWVDFRVPPSERDEVRTALLDWVEAEAEKRAAGRQGSVTRVYTAEVDTPIKQLLDDRGYGLIRHSYRMRIDFEGEPPEPEWPEGVTVRAATAEDIPSAYDLQQETFRDSWAFNPVPFDEWSHWMTSYEGFDLSLWFLAEEGGELAGASLCRFQEAEEGLGWVRILGVRRPWRRRGLGRALLLHTFREFRARGATGVGLGVDAESLTGAERLYESVGMQVVRRFDTYEKELAAGTV
jgi:ribosomal protein S18 acetylase RimI-like enzyme